MNVSCVVCPHNFVVHVLCSLSVYVPVGHVCLLILNLYIVYLSLKHAHISDCTIKILVPILQLHFRYAIPCNVFLFFFIATAEIVL